MASEPISLSASQRTSLESHLAHDRALLTRPDWLAADPRREPALRTRVAHYEQSLALDAARITQLDLVDAILRARAGLGKGAA